MLTIKQDIFESQNIFEAVIDDNIRSLINQVKNSGNKTFDLRDLFKRFTVKIDQIDPSILRVYNLKKSSECKSAEKLYTKSKNDNSLILFFIKDGIVLYSFFSNNLKLIPSKKYPDEFTMNRIVLDWDKPTKAKLFEVSTEVWVLNAEKISTSKLKLDRYNAKLGMWKNTPEFYKQVKEQNIKRYEAAKTNMSISSGGIKKYYKQFLSVQQTYTQYLNDLDLNLLTSSNYKLRDAFERANYNIGKLFEYIARMKEEIDSNEKYYDGAPLTGWGLRDFQRLQNSFESTYKEILEYLDIINKNMTNAEEN